MEIFVIEMSTLTLIILVIYILKLLKDIYNFTSDMSWRLKQMYHDQCYPFPKISEIYEKTRDKDEQ